MSAHTKTVVVFTTIALDCTLCSKPIAVGSMAHFFGPKRCTHPECDLSLRWRVR